MPFPHWTALNLRTTFYSIGPRTLLLGPVWGSLLSVSASYLANISLANPALTEFMYNYLCTALVLCNANVFYVAEDECKCTCCCCWKNILPKKITMASCSLNNYCLCMYIVQCCLFEKYST
jgi:hypothetical protein